MSTQPTVIDGWTIRPPAAGDTEPPAQRLTTPAAVNRNPGNLREPSTGEFRQYGSPEEGFQDLVGDIEAKQTGKTTTGLHAGSTLSEFAAAYAPKQDKNDPVAYAKQVAQRLGVKPETPIGQIQSHDLAAAVAQQEDGPYWKTIQDRVSPTVVDGWTISAPKPEAAASQTVDGWTISASPAAAGPPASRLSPDVIDQRGRESHYNPYAVQVGSPQIKLPPEPGGFINPQLTQPTENVLRPAKPTYAQGIEALQSGDLKAAHEIFGRPPEIVTGALQDLDKVMVGWFQFHQKALEAAGSLLSPEGVAVGGALGGLGVAAEAGPAATRAVANALQSGISAYFGVKSVEAMKEHAPKVYEAVKAGDAQAAAAALGSLSADAAMAVATTLHAESAAGEAAGAVRRAAEAFQEGGKYGKAQPTKGTVLPNYAAMSDADLVKEYAKAARAGDDGLKNQIVTEIRQRRAVGKQKQIGGAVELSQPEAPTPPAPETLAPQPETAPPPAEATPATPAPEATVEPPPPAPAAPVEVAPAEPGEPIDHEPVPPKPGDVAVEKGSTFKTPDGDVQVEGKSGDLIFFRPTGTDAQGKKFKPRMLKLDAFRALVQPPAQAVPPQNVPQETPKSSPIAQSGEPSAEKPVQATPEEIADLIAKAPAAEGKQPVSTMEEKAPSTTVETQPESRQKVDSADLPTRLRAAFDRLVENRRSQFPEFAENDLRRALAGRNLGDSEGFSQDLRNEIADRLGVTADAVQRMPYRELADKVAALPTSTSEPNGAQVSASEPSSSGATAEGQHEPHRPETIAEREAGESQRTPESGSSATAAEAKPAAAEQRTEPESGNGIKVTQIARALDIQVARADGEPVLDIHRKPTGWLQVPHSNGTTLIHPHEDVAYDFSAENERSGTDLHRARSRAQAYAIDNPVQAPPSKAGDLKVEPLFKPTTPVAKPATQVADGAPTLPKELAGAKPRYNHGAKVYSLDFESDIDKAAYIAAQANPSKHDAKYVDFAKQQTGLSEEEVRAHGVAVRQAIKVQAAAAKGGSQAKPEELQIPRQGLPKPKPTAKGAAGSAAAPVDRAPPKPEVKASEPEKPTKPTPKIKPQYQKLIEHRRDVYTPGNVVTSYGGGLDKVLSYEENANGGFSVKVQAVKPDGSIDPIYPYPRTHSTPPDRNTRIVSRAEPEKLAAAETGTQTRLKPVVQNFEITAPAATPTGTETRVVQHFEAAAAETKAKVGDRVEYTNSDGRTGVGDVLTVLNNGNLEVKLDPYETKTRTAGTAVVRPDKLLKLNGQPVKSETNPSPAETKVPVTETKVGEAEPSQPLSELERAVLRATPTGRGREGFSLFSGLIEAGHPERDVRSAGFRLVQRGLIVQVDDPHADGGMFVRTPEGTVALKSSTKPSSVAQTKPAAEEKKPAAAETKPVEPKPLTIKSVLEEKGEPEKKSPPSLGTTGKEIYQGWKELAEGPQPPRGQIVGVVPGEGRFSFKDGKIVRLHSDKAKTGYVSYTKPATDAEIDAIHDAISKGQFQVQAENIYGALGVRDFADAGALQRVHHQATGQPLAEFLETPEGKAWGKRVSPDERKAVGEATTKPEDEEIVLARDTVRHLLDHGRVDDSGARAIELAIRRASLSRREVDAIVDAATDSGNRVADGKDIAAAFKKQYPDDAAVEEMNRVAGVRFENMARPAGSHPKAEAAPRSPRKRTTPAPGTPERQTLEAENKAASAANEASWDKERDLKSQIEKTKPYTQKRAALDLKLSKLKDEMHALSQKSEPLRKQTYRALLEDAATQDENPILRAAAGYKLDEMDFEASAGQGAYRDRLESFTKKRTAIEAEIDDELRRQLPELEAKNRARHGSTEAEVAALTPEEDASAVRKAIVDARDSFMQHPLTADDIDKRLTGALHAERIGVVKRHALAEVEAHEARYREGTGVVAGGNREFSKAKQSISDAYDVERIRQAVRDAKDVADAEIEKSASEREAHAELEKQEIATRSEGMRPIEEKQTNVAKAWNGNVAQPGRFATDGHMVVDTEATKGARITSAVNRKSSAIRSLVPQDTIGQAFTKATKGATAPVDLIGFNGEVAYFASPDGGLIVPVPAEQVAWLNQVVPFDSVLATPGGKGAVVFQRGGKPVSLMMPNPQSKTPQIDVAVAREAVKKPAPAPEGPVRASRESLPAKTETGSPHAAEYRHGVVWVGGETIAQLGKIMGTTDASGFYAPPMASRELLQKLESAGPAYARVTDAVRSAIAESRHHGSIIIVSNERGRGLENLKATVRHERFHQAMGNLMGAARGSILMKHPLAQLAADNLADRYDRADEATMWAEIGAHLAAGPLHWERMGLDRAQAKELFKEYLKLLDANTINRIEHLTPMLNEVLHGERSISQVRQVGNTQDEEAEGRAGRGELRRGVRPSVPGAEARPGQGIAEKLKSLPGETTGAVNIAPLSAEVKKAAETVAKGMLVAKRSVQLIFTPGALAPQTALTLRARTGELARASAIASKALESAYDLFEKMPVDQRWDFYDRVETGRPQTNGALNIIAGIMRQLLDYSRAEVQSLGTGKLDSFIVNYLPHVYKDPQRAEQMFSEFYSKAPYEGKKSFLKRRKYETLKDAMDAGLEPISENPVDLVMLKIREMQKYVMAHRVMQDEKAAGRLVYVPASKKAPAGWQRIDDKVGTVFGPPQITVQQPAVLQSSVGQVGGMLPGNQAPGAQYTGTVPVDVHVPGIRIMGHYFGPADSVRLINNYLSPGLRGNPLFRSYLAVSNAMVQFQLGFSAFHLGFTTMDATISKMALGIYQASHGDFAKAAKSAALTPLELFGVPIAALAKIAEKAGVKGVWEAAAPLSGVIRGDLMHKAYFGPGSQGAELAGLVDSMESAGGRAELDSFYRTQLTKQLLHQVRHASLLNRVLQASLGGAIGGLAFGPVGAGVGGALGAAAALRAPFALAEQLARPIMNYVVPRQKMAVFADLARYDMERYEEGAISLDELKQALADSWTSVDNRMGQLVYDNLHWNKMVKDIGMASLRTVGWQVGTIGEVGGGLADIRKLEPPRRVAHTITIPTASGSTTATKYTWKWDPKVSKKLSYILAMVVVTGVIGSMMHYLATGESPHELKDMYFPRSGPRGTPGWGKRRTLPTYIKDVVHLWTKGPVDTLKGKVNPLLSLIWEMLGNEDYFGKPIAVRNEEWYKNLERETLFALESFEPMSIKPPPKSAGTDTTTDKALRFIGVTPAPAYIQGTAKPRHIKPHEAHF